MDHTSRSSKKCTNRTQRSVVLVSEEGHEAPVACLFDIVLRAGVNGHAVRLRIRSDNLYLDGYRAENSDQWFEFGQTAEQSGRTADPQLIPGSTRLGFDGSYTSLEGAAHRRREEMTLGALQLAQAVIQLATTPDRQERARSLLTVIRMICESIRFTHISDTIANGYSAGFVPDGHFRALENGWGDISGALLHHDQNPEGPIRLTRPNNMGIDSVPAAVAVIGVLLRYSITRQSGPRRRAEALIPSGRPLAEILWVKIDNIDDENPGNLFGTITATDGLSSQYVYNVDSGNRQDVYPHGQVALTGPSRAISAAGSFVIDLDLKDFDYLSPNDEISQGQISWNVYDPSNMYDEPLQKSIAVSYGQATVDYVVMSNAAEALVEVVLIDGDDENPANVYGYVKVYSKFVERELFRKENDYIDVRPGENIPLSRAVMAVPMDSTLRVFAVLGDYDSLSPNDNIARGSVEFKPQVLQSTKQTITGDYGKVEVRITWS
ncbi:hypothetical protein ACQRIU_007017 [Beauveria bassiana]